MASATEMSLVLGEVVNERVGGLECPSSVRRERRRNCGLQGWCARDWEFSVASGCFLMIHERYDLGSTPAMV